MENFNIITKHKTKALDFACCTLKDTNMKLVFGNNSDKSEQLNFEIIQCVIDTTQCSPSIGGCHLRRSVAKLSTSNMFLRNSTRAFRANAILARNPHLLIRVESFAAQTPFKTAPLNRGEGILGAFTHTLTHADHPV